MIPRPSVPIVIEVCIPSPPSAFRTAVVVADEQATLSQSATFSLPFVTSW